MRYRPSDSKGCLQLYNTITARGKLFIGPGNPDESNFRLLYFYQ